MPSPEGDKRGDAIRESRTQDIDATDDMIVHGSRPSLERAACPLTEYFEVF